MRVQFATLGQSPEVVLNALRHVPMDELHLFTDNLEALEVIEIEKFYGIAQLRIPVISHVIDKFDLMQCMLVMIEAVKKVRQERTSQDKLEITLNMTGGTKIMTSAMLLVGYMTGSRVFYLKKLREADGIGELIWIPMPRVSGQEFKDTKLNLIKTLGMINKPISLTTLKNKAGLNSVQAMTRYIQFFEEEDLIFSNYRGKERLISLTNTGRILVALMDD